MYTGVALDFHWLTQCTLGYHWAIQRILAGYTGTPPEKNLFETALHLNATGETLTNLAYTGTPLEELSWNYSTLECHWRNSDYCSLHWNTVYVGLQFSLAQQFAPYQVYTKGVACWEVIWPNDLQTRCCQYTGIPLDIMQWNTLADPLIQWSSNGNPELVHHLHNWVHWDANETTLADASTQWCPSGNPVVICIIGTH